MKKILIVTIPVIIVIVLVVSLLSATGPIPELEKIVQDNDCEAFERWDVKYNEGVGLDISQDLYSKASELAKACMRGTVDDMIKDALDDMNGKIQIDSRLEDHFDTHREWFDIIYSGTCDEYLGWINDIRDEHKILSNARNDNYKQIEVYLQYEEYCLDKENDRDIECVDIKRWIDSKDEYNFWDIFSNRFVSTPSLSSSALNVEKYCLDPNNHDGFAIPDNLKQ